MTPVQEAAARLRDGFNYVQCPDHWQECNDARTLAEAFLELVPADDAELLDEAYLNSIGRYNEAHYRDMKLFFLAGSLAVVGFACEGPKCWNYKIRVRDQKGEDVVTVFENPTRGDLRALLKALNLPLSPTTRQEPA